MNDDPSGKAGTGPSRWLLGAGGTAVEDLLAALRLLSLRPRTDEDPALVSLAQARTALGQMRAQLIEEVLRHEQRIPDSEQPVAEAPVDFDAVKCEIGSRLDRIRDARRAGGVSE